MEDIVAVLLAHDQRRKNNAMEESFGDAFVVWKIRGATRRRGRGVLSARVRDMKRGTFQN
jgi:hypothetical protein